MRLADLGRAGGGVALRGLLPLALFGLLATQVSLAALGYHPYDAIDLNVYRTGGLAVLHGTTLYGSAFSAHMAPRLPFSYPPFAALVMTAVTVVPYPVDVYLWDGLLVVGALLVSVALAYSPLLSRAAWASWARWWVVAGIAAVMLATEPVRDNLAFGQVDVVLMAVCLADVLARPTRRGRGVGVGLATAIKLVPGVFILYFLVTRQNRAAAVSAGTAAVATALGFAVRPHSSLTYFDPSRLFDASRTGPVGYFSNQALLGMLTRAHLGALTHPLVVLTAVVVLVGGLGVARRVTRFGDRLAAAVTVGLTGVLVSPISWIHETVWLVPAIGVFAAAAYPAIAAPPTTPSTPAAGPAAATPSTPAAASATPTPATPAPAAVLRSRPAGGPGRWGWGRPERPWFLLVAAGVLAALLLRLPAVGASGHGVAAAVLTDAFGLISLVALPLLALAATARDPQPVGRAEPAGVGVLLRGGANAAGAGAARAAAGELEACPDVAMPRRIP